MILRMPFRKRQLKADISQGSPLSSCTRPCILSSNFQSSKQCMRGNILLKGESSREEAKVGLAIVLLPKASEIVLM